MKIEILGDGCARCKALKTRVQQAVEELEVDAEIISVMDPERIAELQAMSLPQVTIDGQITPPGSLGSVHGIKELLRSTNRSQ